MHAITRNKLLVVTYMLTILYALHYGIPLYATSSYLHQYFSASWVSALYMIGSVISLWASMSVTQRIKKFHSYKFTASLAIAEILITILFALSSNMYLIALFFIVHFTLQALLYVSLNVFIESFSNHAETGSIRGLFLALLNMGILISPLIGGTILANGSFQMLYIVASLTLVPFLFFLHKYLQHVKEPAYHTIDMAGALKLGWQNKNLRAALVSILIVQCFYAVMVIYSPIYLATIGISLPTYLSFIIPLALIPLVLLPYELGMLADTKLGEKELLIIGLLILAVTTLLCVVVTSPDPRVWVFLLLISRIGAACVETMAFTYYFKKVGPEDASLTALFSNAYAVATIIVGAVGVAVAPLLVTRPQLMFVILGCAILWSISYVLPMKDTR
ncbi:MAG: MFS transporter [Candidatus Paceibacterota bacterium]